MRRDFYNQLLEKKKNGEELDFDKITYKEMYQLWHSEAIPDSVIADLFGVLKKQVTKKRYREFGIRQMDCIIDEVLKRDDIQTILRNS